MDIFVEYSVIPSGVVKICRQIILDPRFSLRLKTESMCRRRRFSFWRVRIWSETQRQSIS